MPSIKPPAVALQRAREKGSRNHRNGINNEKVQKGIDPNSEKKYGGALALWNEFCANQGVDPVASALDLEKLKEFVNEAWFGIDGMYGDPLGGQNSILNIWNFFTAAFRRKYYQIPADTTLSVKNFMKEHIFVELQAPPVKRVRRFATKTHLQHLGEQLWKKDWHEYKAPKTRVHTWGRLILCTYTSARICEYIESTCRPNSGRGLYHRDMKFGVFRNENGDAEVAAQVIRDAKNMTWTPHKRPEHTVYEGSKPGLLLTNPMLIMLAMFIASGAFRDYKTVREVFSISAPPEGEVYVLEWNDENTPFFPGRNGHILKATSFSRELRALGRRAGYLEPPTVHDFRAESLYQIDKTYSEAQRMKHAGHNNPKTYNNFYAPNNSGVDGKAAYDGDEPREIVNDLFRSLNLVRNPELYQSLPAETKHELESREDYMALKKELRDLRGGPRTTAEERGRLSRQIKKLEDAELRKCQAKQRPSPPSSLGDGTYSMSYHRGRFARVGRMMPERTRLSTNMFLVTSLRSPEGRSVLDDLVTLCRQEAEVAFRPGLEPEKCHCLTFGVEEAKGDRKRKPQTWKHVYRCHKTHLKREHGFAELCFLCDEWITRIDAWKRHCQDHLNKPESIPVQCDPLMYGGTLAAAGLCPTCIGNADLPATQRMRQYLHRNTWMDHVSNCFQVEIAQHKSSLENDNELKCAHLHSRCAIPFDSVQRLRFHYQDVHCVSFAKGTKRRLSNTEIELSRRADTEVARPEELRNMAPNMAEVEGTCQQRVQHTFVPETGKKMKMKMNAKAKTKSTSAGTATLRSKASRGATSGFVNNQVVVPREGPLATVDQRSSVLQALASSNRDILNPPSDGQVGDQRRRSGRPRKTRKFFMS